jgi:hypothetical protein
VPRAAGSRGLALRAGWLAVGRAGRMVRVALTERAGAGLTAPATAMAPFFALTLLALASCAAVAAVRGLWRSQAGPRWWGGLALSAALGAAVGVWCGFFCEYRPIEELRVFSFPVPAYFFHLEDGDWVDYVVPAPLVVAVCNSLSLTLLAVLPVWAAYRLLHRARGRNSGGPG